MYLSDPSDSAVDSDARRDTLMLECQHEVFGCEALASSQRHTGLAQGLCLPFPAVSDHGKGSLALSLT